MTQASRPEGEPALSQSAFGKRWEHSLCAPSTVGMISGLLLGAGCPETHTRTSCSRKGGDSHCAGSGQGPVWARTVSGSGQRKFLQQHVPSSYCLQLLRLSALSTAHLYLKVRLLVGDRDRQHEDPELDLLREQ